MTKSFKLCDGMASSVPDDIKSKIITSIFQFKVRNTHSAISQRRYQFIQDKTKASGKPNLLTKSHPIQKQAHGYHVSFNPEYTNKNFLFFTNFENQNKCYDVQDRGQKTSVNNSKICSINFRVTDKWHQGTLLCGNMMKNHIGRWIFLVEDIWIIGGQNIVQRNLEHKFYLLSKFLEGYVSDREVEICQIIPASFYYIRDLPRLASISETYPINGYIFHPSEIGTRYIFNFHQNNDYSPVQKNHKLAYFQISLVEDSQLPDQYLMHCVHQGRLAFIGFAEVPDKYNRLGLIEILESQESVILPCRFNRDLGEWTIVNLVASSHISNVIEARQILSQ